MTHHIILWKLRADVADKDAAKARVKEKLEALNGRIPGLVSLTVHIGGLESSSADMMLDSLFENPASLAAYQIDPRHLEAAGYVRSVIESRLCLDFEDA